MIISTGSLLQAADSLQATGTASGVLGTLAGLGRGPMVRAGLTLLLGVPFTYWLSRLIRRAIARRYDAQWGLVAGKLVFYPLLLLLLTSVLRELGFSLAPLLGAAGILGIALGFASQTSVSNVISGFFLIGERPFGVGDVIQVGDVTGTVLSVDMLSVKLRTFDNRFVRIPNESIIKSQVTNVTRFPIRRVDVPVAVAYKEDLDGVRGLLLDVADKNTMSLMEPEPKVFFDGFGDSSVNLRLAVWTTRENFLALKNGIQADVKARFDQERVEIPFPHRTLYAGSATGPLPVTMVQAPSSADDGRSAP